MPIRPVLCLLSLVALLSCGAYEFELETSSPSVKPTSIEFREVSSRGWLPGCSDLDVLQGTGFYPTTTYYHPSWEKVDTNRYRARAERGVRETMCDTRVDEINEVLLERGLVGSGSVDYARFTFAPTGDDPAAPVLCAALPAAATTEYEPLVCSTPEVRVVPGDTVRFTVVWP